MGRATDGTPLPSAIRFLDCFPVRVRAPTCVDDDTENWASDISEIAAELQRPLLPCFPLLEPISNQGCPSMKSAEVLNLLD